MSQEDRDRILQLVAYVQQAYHGEYRRYAQIPTALINAHELCNAVVKSLPHPRIEYYCPDCSFQPAEESGPDLVCTKCRLVLITFREV
jgi:hypothetical protein